ncbi:MAG TPA: hypothetical protein VJ301_14485 [Propionibacteriaceae bacterium]|nr:hypothetical protein [Propionibacteriaceae bacterium]
MLILILLLAITLTGCEGGVIDWNFPGLQLLIGALVGFGIGYAVFRWTQYEVRTDRREKREERREDRGGTP